MRMLLLLPFFLLSELVFANSMTPPTTPPTTPRPPIQQGQACRFPKTLVPTMCPMMTISKAKGMCEKLVSNFGLEHCDCEWTAPNPVVPKECGKPNNVPNWNPVEICRRGKKGAIVRISGLTNTGYYKTQAECENDPSTASRCATECATALSKDRGIAQYSCCM